MNYAHLCKPWEHALTRRQLFGSLAGVGLGAAGLARLLQPAAAAEIKARRKQVLFIWIDGGMSQLETWDPKPNTRFGGPFRAIPTSVPGIHISELMPRTAQVMHHLAIVRSLHTQDNSHSAGVPRVQRGDPKNRGVTYPFMGSAVAYWLGDGGSGLPPYVSIRPGGGGFAHADTGFLSPKYGAVVFGDGKPPANMVRPKEISDDDDELRNWLRANAVERYAAGRRPTAAEASNYVHDMARTLMQREELFDTNSLDRRDVERYGSHQLGRHLLQARKMLEAGVTFVKVSTYGWDTHGDNFNGHRSLVPQLDQAFAAVVEDLADRGMLDDVLVITLSEFGRTPRINGHVGRDHWPNAWSVAMAGAGLQRGIAVGHTNAEGTDVASDPLDIGHLFHTWFHVLGIDPTSTEYHVNDQPLPVAHDEMHAIDELLV